MQILDFLYKKNTLNHPYSQCSVVDTQMVLFSAVKNNVHQAEISIFFHAYPSLSLSTFWQYEPICSNNDHKCSHEMWAC